MRTWNLTWMTLALVVSAWTLSVWGQEVIEIDPNLKPYQKVSGVSGTLNSVGSDTLNNLMALWSEGFKKQYPNVNLQVEGKGSSTAPPALMEGVAQLGPMSRPMKKEELEAFEKKLGFKPTPIGVALDALAIYVNKDNPLERLSLPEVDAVFSKTRKGGFSKDLRTWGDVGVKGALAARPLSAYGRNSASGTYGYFKKKALFKGDYKDSVKEQPGSASVVMGVTEDLAGIGYSGIGYQTSGVKAIKISKKAGGKAYTANANNVLDKKYPLGRMLYVYIAKKPNEESSKLVREFLKFVLSKEGQSVVVKSGYIPLPEPMSLKQQALL